VHVARTVLAAFGWRGLLRRGRYLAMKRSGWLRHCTASRPSFDDAPAAAWPHRFDLERVRRDYGQAGLLDSSRQTAVAAADELLAGSWLCYGGLRANVGWPPAWTTNPVTGAEYLPVHWTALSDDEPSRGDIKDVWELSRFGCTTVLARAYLLTDDDRYPEAWWSLVENWAEANPPYRGPNWMCAQEASLRAMAWCFGLSTFADHRSTTAGRRQLLERMLGATTERVQPTLCYGLSQRNNHAISELSFLLTVAAPRRARIERLLTEALDDQFLADGSYTQQSLVYHRLAVHTLAWLLTCGALSPAVAAAVRLRLAASKAFLARCCDPVSGGLMSYGANDGSSLLTIGSADPLDGCSTLAMLGEPVGAPVHEAALWMRVDAGAPPPAVSDTTYVTLRGNRSALLTRIGTTPGRRPGDDDQQAVELFIDGDRVLLDPGTFRYSGTGRWRNPFVGIDTHCGVTAPKASPRPALGRFLRSPMPRATVTHQCSQGNADVIRSRRAEGRVELTRTVIRNGDRYAILDEVVGGPSTVRWNLAAMDEIRISDGHMRASGPARVEIDGQRVHIAERSADDPSSGWWSPTYGVLAPCVAVTVPLSAGGSTVLRAGPLDQPLLSDPDIFDVIGASGPHS
jgi:hypothetical protein